MYTVIVPISFMLSHAKNVVNIMWAKQKANYTKDYRNTSEALKWPKRHMQNLGRSQGLNIFPLDLHFAQLDHNGTKHLKIQVLYFVNFHPDSLKAQKTRLRVKKKWIHTLRCPAPNGMNIFD
jgi:hypothetical protein